MSSVSPRSTSVATGSRPMKENLLQRSPFSTDSSKKPGPSSTSFKNAETGVSRSPVVLFGNEFDGQQDPFEAGIGFAVPLKTKTDDFIGKEQLIKRKENPQKKLVGLELIGKEKANHGDCVHIGRAQVGIVTSACLSPTLGKNIALCRIDVGHSEINTEVEIGKIDGHQKRIPAKIVGFPHYDPQKTKVRS